MHNCKCTCAYSGHLFELDGNCSHTSTINHFSIINLKLDLISYFCGHCMYCGQCTKKKKKPFNGTQSMGIFPFQNNILLGNVLTLSLKENVSRRSMFGAKSEF